MSDEGSLPCDHPKDKVSTYTAGDPFEECRACGAWRPLGAPAWGNKPASAWHLSELPDETIHRLQNRIVELCAERDKLQRQNDSLHTKAEQLYAALLAMLKEAQLGFIGGMSRGSPDWQAANARYEYAILRALGRKP